MRLSKNESEVKSYTYASAGKLKSTLTVTTKRVIFSKEGKLGGTKIRTNDEINLDSIERVSSLTTVKTKPALLIFALLFAIATAVVYLFFYPESLTLIVGGALALLFLICFFTVRKRAFYLSFVTGIYDGMDLTANIGVIKKTKKKKTKYAKEIKVRLNSLVAATIVDEIGSVILDAKEYANVVEETDTVEKVEDSPATSNQPVETVTD